jgi:hypothetical protein
MHGYIEAVLELVLDVLFDDGGLPDRLVTQEDDLVLGATPSDRARRHTHTILLYNKTSEIELVDFTSTILTVVGYSVLV